jgi:hypothetical protein
LGLAEVTRRLLCGEMPGQPQRDTYTVILAGETWAQLGSTIGYLWSLTGGEDGGWWSSKLTFSEGELRGKKLQVYDLVGGPHPGSTLRCGTFSAGARRLAGPRADGIVTDEPPKAAVFDELWARLIGRQGRAVIGFTPTAGTCDDLKYLWRLTDDPAIGWAGQIQVELNLDNCTPRGGLIEVPWTTQAEIDRIEQGTSKVMAPMRMGRSRTPLAEGAYYSAWGPHLLLDEPPAWFTKAIEEGRKRGRGAAMPRIGVGIDHGSKPGAQRAVLSHAWGVGAHTRIWISDEYKADGRTEAADDARGLIAMLARNGYALEDVDLWVGDRAHAGDWRGGKKSNFRLQQALAEATGIDTRSRGWFEKLPEALRKMRTPYKRDQSVYEGADIIHRAMLRGPEWYAVSSRCAALDEDHRAWRGGKNEQAKDGCDGERYVVVPQIEGRRH